MTRRILASLMTGIIFGAGLAISGLADPDNVLRFLTISGDWSPALLFVMGSGIAVTYSGYKWILKRGPLLEKQLHLPTKTELDPRLISGAVIFGVGWGLAGFCPGPAIVGLSSGLAEPFIFVAAMIAGSQLQKLMS